MNDFQAVREIARISNIIGHSADAGGRIIDNAYIEQTARAFAQLECMRDQAVEIAVEMGFSRYNGVRIAERSEQFFEKSLEREIEERQLKDEEAFRELLYEEKRAEGEGLYGKHSPDCEGVCPNEGDASA